MITLSDDHVTDLQEAQRRYYYQDLGNFFAGREPALFATLSPEERLTFAYGAESRAKAHGLGSTPGIYAWADCMILLGAHWERDPYFAPLAAILKGTSPFDEDDRIEEAQAWLTDYLPAARGDGACHFKAGFQGLIDLALPDDQIANYALPLGMDLEAALLGLVEQMYPSMLAWHGPEPTRDRLRILLHSASRYYGVSGTWHLTYYAMLGMTCGVGQDQDEVLPWIRRSLARIQTLGPEQAIVRLSRRARTWFEHVLDDWPAKTSPDDEAKEA